MLRTGATCGSSRPKSAAERRLAGWLSVANSSNVRALHALGHSDSTIAATLRQGLRGADVTEWRQRNNIAGNVKRNAPPRSVAPVLSREAVGTMPRAPVPVAAEARLLAGSQRLSSDIRN